MGSPRRSQARAFRCASPIRRPRRGRWRSRELSPSLEDLGGDPAALNRIEVVDGLAACVKSADFVIEAAPEDLELKQGLFADIERLAAPEAILASNTSVIPIGQVMDRVRRKGRALGTHWWNPPYLVPLVEVVRAKETSGDAVAATLAVLKQAGKHPVEVKRDVAGFVGNRLQHALWREAIALIAEGVCDARTVDEVVKLGFGARLAVLGPIENADLVGLDVMLAIQSYVLPALNAAPAPSPLLDELIAQGRLGFKSGRGFLDWPEDKQAALRARLTKPDPSLAIRAVYGQWFPWLVLLDR